MQTISHQVIKIVNIAAHVGAVLRLQCGKLLDKCKGEVKHKQYNQNKTNRIDILTQEEKKTVEENENTFDAKFPEGSVSLGARFSCKITIFT